MINAKELWIGYSRMCDSYVNCKGCPACLDSDDCTHDGMLCDDIENTDKFIEIVEQWVKDNPIITNKMKFKEVFGYEITVGSCPLYEVEGCRILNDESLIQHKCSSCPWWDSEYKKIQGE